MENWMENWMVSDVQMTSRSPPVLRIQTGGRMVSRIQIGGRMVLRSPLVSRIPSGGRMASRSPPVLRIQSGDRMTSRIPSGDRMTSGGRMVSGGRMAIQRKGPTSLRPIASWTAMWRETQKSEVWMSWFVRQKRIRYSIV